MTRRPRQQAAGGWLSRAVAVLLAIMASTAGAAVAGTPASAAARPIGDCTTTSGVVVVVDFGHWGGPLLRFCGTTPATGYALLNQGGWHTAGTEHDGPGFICRIGYAGYHGGTLYPTPAQESCVLTPPASAYWSFWQASRGQHTWSYSQAGAMSYDPEPGSVELWAFGGTSAGGTTGSAVPAFSPDSVRALNTSPDGAATASPASTSPASTGAAARATGAPGTVSPAASARKSTPAAGRAPPARTPDVLDAPPAAASAHVSHGSPVPALIALVVVLLLAAAGITAAARRPRRER